jgi:WS/DGAT/MGAT family acyltransferase
MIYVLDGLASGEKAYYFKIHHAMLDGQAGTALAAALFDTSPVPVSIPPAVGKVRLIDRKPGALSLVASAFRHDAAQYVKLVRELPGVVRLLAGMVRNAAGSSRGGDKSEIGHLKNSVSFGPRTPLNVTITRERGFAAATIPLAEVKAMAAATEATVNDIVLALCSGALRRYLGRLGPLPKKSLIASMPISLREKGNTDFHTQATLSLVSLATNVADPLRRLQAIRGSAGATKAVAKRAKSVIPTDFPSIGVPWLIGSLASLYGRSNVSDVIPPLANVLISNVPGPSIPLYVGGLRMTGYWPLSIVEHGVGLNITLMSYAGTLCLGFTVARCAVPDVRQLADDFLDAHEELRRKTLEKCAVQPRRPKVARKVK